MAQSEDIRCLFRHEEQGRFDFSGAPALVISRESATAGLDSLDPATTSRWRRTQDGFLTRARSEDKYPRQKLEQVKARDAALFRERGYLHGTVLDIGGGWGLYREWWERGDRDVFVVHDPGVDRFLSDAYAAHHECYRRAFSLPMTFVEGFGESLPYKDDLFDTCIIAAALDHCADPQAVLSEANRCLKQGGRLIVLQTCDLPRSRRFLHFAERVVCRLRHPLSLLSKLYAKTLGPPDHMSHFAAERLVGMLEEAGFQNVRTHPVKQAVYMFEASKACV